MPRRPDSPTIPRTPPRPAVRPSRRSTGSGLIDGSDDTTEGGPNNDRWDANHNPALLDFAHWFADWWLRRGRDLTRALRSANKPQRAVALCPRVNRGAGPGLLTRRAARGDRRFAAENDLELSASTATSTQAGASPRPGPEFQRLMADAAERQVRRRARLPHLALRAKPGRVTPLQAAAARAARHPRHLRHPADGRRPHRPLGVPRRVDPRDVRRVLLRLAVLLDTQRA